MATRRANLSWHARGGRAVLLALLLLAGPATAQEIQPGRMYVNSGLLIGSTKLVGLGGAYAGIGEGTAALTSNLATLAHRKPTIADDWSFDAALSYLDLPFGNPQARDFDNDGVADDARLVRQLVTGLMLQLRGVGIGGYSRTSYLRHCLTLACVEGDLEITLANSAIAGAVALGEDALILSLGLYMTSGEFAYGGGRWSYAALGPTFDVLFRPPERSFRLGLSIKPQIIARLDGRPGPFEGRPPFAALASPLTLSLGGSVRLGDGAERYNTLSIAKLRELGRPFTVPLQRGPSTTPPGRWLLSAQVDVLGPVEEAVPLQAILATPATTPLRIARRTMVAPRLGAEHETLPGRLRLRAGTYMEPSPFEGRSLRPHLTGGVEVFLLHYLDDWAVSLSFDVAERYADFGLSIGFWR